MKIRAIIHEAEEGGYWAEVPSIPGCATQGESMEESLSNLREAVEGCLAAEERPVLEECEFGGKPRLVEITGGRS